MLLLFLALLFSLNERSQTHETIPDELRRRVREAYTFHDLMSVTQLAYAPHLLDSAQNLKNRKTLQLAQIRHRTNNPEELRLEGAALVNLPSSSHTYLQAVNANTRTNLEILSTIRQGNDTCLLQNICVPVPVDNPDPGLIVFPRCYEANQCVGSCCDSFESCHPTSVEYIQRPIVEMLYVGNNQFVINQTRNITVEQHLACSCRDCIQSDVALKCPKGKIVGPDCNCECDKEAKKVCEGWVKLWNEDTCTCECAIKHCHGNTVLDTNTCLCRHRRSQQSYTDPDSFGNFRSDISRLQKLRLRKARPISL